MKAACNGHTDIALTLMDAGADIHIVAKVSESDHGPWTLNSRPGSSILDIGPGPWTLSVA